MPTQWGLADAAAPSQDTDDGGRLTSFGRHRQLVFAPSGWVPDVTSRELPNVTLEREHVHGMDGSCPGTVHFVGEDRCIYIAARLCVVEDLRESRQTFFEGHNSDVLCLSYSEAHHLAISGQQDPPGEGCPFACVWSPSFPSRPLAELRCYQERKGGNPPPRLQYGSDSSYIDLPPEFDPKTMVEVPLRSIVSVAIASNGRFAAMSALDEKKSICLYHLPADVTRPRKSEPAHTYVIKVPALLIGPGGNPCEMMVPNPFDGDGGFRFAALTKTAVKLWEYRQATQEVKSSSVVFGKNPQQQMTYVAYVDKGHLLMCGKDGHLYNVEGGTCHNSASVSTSLGCAVPLGHCKGSAYHFAVGASDGSFMLGRTEQEEAVRGKKQKLGHRPCVIVRFNLGEVPAEPNQVWPKDLRPHWKSLQVNEQGLCIAASAGHVLVLLDLGLREGSSRRLLRVLQVGHKVEAFALAPHPKILELCATGDERGVIHFWDLEAKKPLLHKMYRSDLAVRSLAFSPEGDMLALGQSTGLLKLLDFPSLEGIFHRRLSRPGKDGEVLSWIAFSNYADSAKSRYLACASWDQNVYLLRIFWKQKKEVRQTPQWHQEVAFKGALSGNSSSPTHVMFTDDAQFVVSTSKDLNVLVWKTGTGERISKMSSLRDSQFSCWRLPLGFPVAGVWRQEYAQSDVNAVCQSHASGPGPAAGEVIAVGDDQGAIWLYRFPSPLSLAAGREYLGHASFVTNLQFTPGNILLTVGGNDHTVMQWRMKPMPKSHVFGRGHRPRSQPPRQLPWATEKPSTPQQLAPEGATATDALPAAPAVAPLAMALAAPTAQEVLDQLGQPSGRPPRPRGAPERGYAGFRGPFAGEDRPASQPASSVASSAGRQQTRTEAESRRRSSRGGIPPRRASSADLGKNPQEEKPGLRALSLRSRTAQTPAGARCRRIASGIR